MTINANRMKTQLAIGESGLSAPAPGGWLKEAQRLATADAMRSQLADRYPALQLAKMRHIAIVGAGPEGQRLAALCAAQGIIVVAVADDNPVLKDSMISGVPVRPVADLSVLDKDIPVVIASHRPLLLPKRLADLGFKTIALFLVLQVLDPDRFPAHVFYHGWFEDLARNIEQYKKLIGTFEDETSAVHLDSILGFRLTGDTRALFGSIDWNVYAPDDLFTFRNDEVYVDGGAFDGDSIRIFIERVRGAFERVIGFEPDPETFERLKRNFAGDSRIEPIAKGLYGRTDSLSFVADASRGAGIHAQGDLTIQVTSLDDVLDGDRVSFIKMNIEGAELEALEGARKSIAKWGPRLAISAYHRPEHLWQVPLLMKSLRQTYRIALRQHDLGVIETVAYAY
jgi:FkbM family methyltransferase